MSDRKKAELALKNINKMLEKNFEEYFVISGEIADYYDEFNEEEFDFSYIDNIYKSVKDNYDFLNSLIKCIDDIAQEFELDSDDVRTVKDMVSEYTYVVDNEIEKYTKQHRDMYTDKTELGREFKCDEDGYFSLFSPNLEELTAFGEALEKIKDKIISKL